MFQVAVEAVNRTGGAGDYGEIANRACEYIPGEYTLISSYSRSESFSSQSTSISQPVTSQPQAARPSPGRWQPSDAYGQCASTVE